MAEKQYRAFTLAKEVAAEKVEGLDNAIRRLKRAKAQASENTKPQGKSRATA